MYQWIISRDNFTSLFNDWVNSSYDVDLIPSVDRIDDYLPYSFKNITLTTWKNNREKSYKDRLSGANEKGSRGVIQYSKSGKFIKRWASVSLAARSTNIKYSTLYASCQKEFASSGGFKWRFI